MAFLPQTNAHITKITGAAFTDDVDFDSTGDGTVKFAGKKKCLWVNKSKDVVRDQSKNIIDRVERDILYLPSRFTPRPAEGDVVVWVDFDGVSHYGTVEKIINNSAGQLRSCLEVYMRAR